MKNTASVNLWGREIGAVFWDSTRNCAFFEYTEKFRNSSIELSPLTMPLADKIYSFPGISRLAFHGLPGLLADSLPDRFGNEILATWLTRIGRTVAGFNPLDRLRFLGKRGMGALEFSPVSDFRASKPKTLDIESLVSIAGKALSSRDAFVLTVSDKDAESLSDLVLAGSPAGGAKAKLLVSWNQLSNEMRSGHDSTDTDFSQWLLKLDGVANNKDRELKELKYAGLIEYAYHLMALDAGIEMTECRVFEENGRHHFMTRRFDRSKTGSKIHMQSLAALGHFDFNRPDVYSYEQALQVIVALKLGATATEQMFRRACFNIIARNQDDHVKNIAFLMNKSGEWFLAPAFDLVYSYNPDGILTSKHQMSLNGKRDGFEISDFIACGEKIFMRRAKVLEILEQVMTAVKQWKIYAEVAEVPTSAVLAIEQSHQFFTVAKSAR